MKLKQNSRAFTFFKNTVIGFLFISSFSANAAEQVFSKTIRQEKPAKFGVTLSPLYLVLGGLGAKGEYFITDRVSAGLSGIYIPSHKVESSDEDSKNEKIKYNWEYSEILLSSNIMLTGTLASNGFYLSPGVGYQRTAITDYSEFDLSGSLASPFGQLTAGYQWVMSTKFRLAAGAGAKFMQSGDVVIKDSNDKEVLREKASNWGGLALDLHVGYLF